MIKIQNVKIKFTDDDKFLIAELSYFPGQFEEVKKYIDSDENLKNTYGEVKKSSEVDSRKFSYYIYSKREDLKLISEELPHNNSSIPLMFLDSEYNSLKNFCKAWLMHFDFSGATFS